MWEPRHQPKNLSWSGQLCGFQTKTSTRMLLNILLMCFLARGRAPLWSLAPLSLRDSQALWGSLGVCSDVQQLLRVIHSSEVSDHHQPPSLPLSPHLLPGKAPVHKLSPFFLKETCFLFCFLDALATVDIQSFVPRVGTATEMCIREGQSPASSEVGHWKHCAPHTPVKAPQSKQCLHNPTCLPPNYSFGSVFYHDVLLGIAHREGIFPFSQSPTPLYLSFS